MSYTTGYFQQPLYEPLDPHTQVVLHTQASVLIRTLFPSIQAQENISPVQFKALQEYVNGEKTIDEETRPPPTPQPPVKQPLAPQQPQQPTPKQQQPSPLPKQPQPQVQGPAKNGYGAGAVRGMLGVGYTPRDPNYHVEMNNRQAAFIHQIGQYLEFQWHWKPSPRIGASSLSSSLSSSSSSATAVMTDQEVNEINEVINATEEESRLKNSIRSSMNSLFKQASDIHTLLQKTGRTDLHIQAMIQPIVNWKNMIAGSTETQALDWLNLKETMPFEDQFCAIDASLITLNTKDTMMMDGKQWFVIWRCPPDRKGIEVCFEEALFSKAGIAALSSSSSSSSTTSSSSSAAPITFKRKRLNMMDLEQHNKQCIAHGLVIYKLRPDQRVEDHCFTGRGKWELVGSTDDNKRLRLRMISSNTNTTTTTTRPGSSIPAPIPSSSIVSSSSSSSLSLSSQPSKSGCLLIDRKDRANIKPTDSILYVQLCEVFKHDKEDYITVIQRFGTTYQGRESIYRMAYIKKSHPKFVKALNEYQKLTNQTSYSSSSSSSSSSTSKSKSKIATKTTPGVVLNKKTRVDRKEEKTLKPKREEPQKDDRKKDESKKEKPKQVSTTSSTSSTSSASKKQIPLTTGLCLVRNKTQQEIFRLIATVNETPNPDELFADEEFTHFGNIEMVPNVKQSGLIDFKWKLHYSITD